MLITIILLIFRVEKKNSTKTFEMKYFYFVMIIKIQKYFKVEFIIPLLSRKIGVIL